MSINVGDAPHAIRWQIGSCGLCPNAHVILYDENEKIIATFTIGPDQIDPFTNSCREVMRDMRTENIRRQNEGNQ